MKKILLCLLFIVSAISMNAQEIDIVEKSTILENPNSLEDYALKDIQFIPETISLTNTQLDSLRDILYYKYKMLSGGISENTSEYNTLVNETKLRIKELIGNEYFSLIENNQQLLNRLTGAVYITE